MHNTKGTSTISDYFTQSTAPERSYSFFDKIRHALEIILGMIFVFIPYRLLGKGYVTIICFLIKFFGPLSKHHQRIVKNLDLAFPDMSADKKSKIAKESWTNIAKIPYDFFMARYTPYKMKLEISGLEHLEALKKSGQNAIFFSGHNACWEIFRVAAHQQGIDIAIIYRAFNNPMFDAYARRFMDHGFASIFQKNPLGVRKMIEHVRNNGHVLILNDQRLSKGVSVPFFNHNALTAPSAAELAMKYDLPLIPVFVTRKGWGDYKIIIYPEIKIVSKITDRKTKIHAALSEMNKIFETHIQQYPHEWFWLHQRWKM